MKCVCGCWWLAHRKKVEDGERKTVCRNCDCEDFEAASGTDTEGSSG